MLLDKIYYTVNSLEGDYAYLQRDDDMSEGSRLVYEMMSYSLVTE